eukprot:scaffold76983_cov48-Prasinocladus_malaysianus.AAC.1
MRRMAERVFSRTCYRLVTALSIAVQLVVVPSLDRGVPDRSCPWVSGRLTRPALPERFRVLMIHTQPQGTGAVVMRANQLAEALDSHPDIDVDVRHVRDCQKYCLSRRDPVDELYTHVVYVKYPCSFCRRHKKTPQLLDLTPFRIFLIGRYMKQLKGLIEKVEQILQQNGSQFPVELTPMQIYGRSLAKDFAYFASADIAVVWTQCSGSRFGELSKECYTHKPSTRMAAGLSVGLPTLMHGGYTSHRELAAQFNITDKERDLVLPTTAEQLASSLHELMSDSSLRLELSTQGKQLSHQFSLMSIAEQYAELLRDVVAI